MYTRYSAAPSLGCYGHNCVAMSRFRIRIYRVLIFKSCLTYVYIQTFSYDRSIPFVTWLAYGIFTNPNFRPSFNRCITTGYQKYVHKQGQSFAYPFLSKNLVALSCPKKESGQQETGGRVRGRLVICKCFSYTSTRATLRKREISYHNNHE